MKAGVKLTQEVIDQIVLDFKAGMLLKDIASKNNVHKESVTKYTRLANLSREPKWSADFLAKLKEEYLAGETLTALAAKYNVCRVDLGRKLKQSGLELFDHPTERRQLVKHNPFENLTDPNTQYWLGWLASDGCVTDRGAVILTICKDPEMLDKYIAFVGEPLKVSCTKQANSINPKYFVEFYSRALAKYLTDLGITPRKSFTLNIKFPFTWDFVRGYLDGNGWCKNYKLSSTLYWCTTSISFADQLADFLVKENVSIRRSASQNGRSSVLYNVRINKVKSSTLNKLYPEGCTYLSRKKPINVIED